MDSLSALIAPVQRPFGQSFHSKSTMLHLIDGVLNTGVHDYFAYLHQLWPVVDANAVQERFAHKEHLHNERFAAMVMAMCALQLFLPHSGADEGTTGRAEALLREAVALHNTPDLGSEPTLESISTTMLIASVLRVTRGFNAFYVRSREAIALAELLDLAHPDTYAAFSDSEKAVAVHIVWLLAAVER